MRAARPLGRSPSTTAASAQALPIVDANAGSSGMALFGASAFGDDAYLAGLVASLDLAAFPVDDKGGRRYAASNQVGDAALLY
ncbi:MAG: hypothetical protein HYY06_09970, partial [Deltaproteobacteria bacterium]|nr:hypothetical protein [Deltaproteobacteria bacterium]